MGFHADQEAVRILAQSIDYARQGRMAVRGVPGLPTVQANPAPPQTAQAAPPAGVAGSAIPLRAAPYLKGYPAPDAAVGKRV